MRELLLQENELEDERKVAAKIVAEARATAPRLANMSAISEQRNRWVAYKVGTASLVSGGMIDPRDSWRKGCRQLARFVDFPLRPEVV